MCWKHLSYLWVKLQVPSRNSNRSQQKRREVDKEKVSCKCSQTTAFTLLSVHHSDVCLNVQLTLSKHMCYLGFFYARLGSVRWQPKQWRHQYSKHCSNLGREGKLWAYEKNKKRGGRKGERGKVKCKTAMFRVILSLGPDVVLALLFLSLCRENTLWSRQFEWLWASAKTRLRLAFLTVCLVLRVSELGRFTIENPVKGFSRKYAWNVTRWGWRN